MAWTKFNDWPRWLQIAHLVLMAPLVYSWWVPKTKRQWIWVSVVIVYSMIVLFVFMR